MSCEDSKTFREATGTLCYNDPPSEDSLQVTESSSSTEFKGNEDICYINAS